MKRTVAILMILVLMFSLAVNTFATTAQDGFVASVENEGDNDLDYVDKEEDKGDGSPDTGDNSAAELALWIVVMATSLSLILVLLFAPRRKKKSSK